MGLKRQKSAGVPNAFGGVKAPLYDTVPTALKKPETHHLHASPVFYSAEEET